MRDNHRHKVFKYVSHTNGVSIPINKESNFIYSKENQKNVDKFLDKEVGSDIISAYVFPESVRKHEIARKIGAQQVRHCGLTTRLGILVRGKLGYAGGLYDLLAKILGLPTERRLQEYTIPSSNDPDGFLINNALREMQSFDQRNPDAGPFDWERHSTLAFDSMT